MHITTSYLFFLLNSVFERFTAVLSQLHINLSSIQGNALDISQFLMNNFLTIGCFFCVGVVVLIVLGQMARVKRQKVVRTKSFAQLRHLRAAKLGYKKLVKSDEDPEVLLKAIDLDGWSFELLVLYVFQRHSKHLKWIATPKLTGDFGIDGAVVTKSGVYIIQSKYYSTSVSIDSVRELAKLVNRLNERKSKNNWHRVIGIPKKYTLNPDVKFIAVLATTGRLSENSRKLCAMHNVKIMYWSLLVDSIKKKSLSFF